MSEFNYSYAQIAEMKDQFFQLPEHMRENFLQKRGLDRKEQNRLLFKILRYDRGERYANLKNTLTAFGIRQSVGS